MKKKELSALTKPTATQDVIQMAKEDKPEEIGFGNHMRYRYHHELYLVAEVEEEILKVSMFLPEYLTLGGKNPIYTLFADKKRDTFTGYHVIQQKWTDAMLYHLDFIWGGTCKAYCNEASTKCIQEYLGMNLHPYEAIQTFQQGVRRRNILKKHKKLTDQWDAVMRGVPKIPKSFEHWIKKTGLRKHFIFYEYTRKGADKGYCTWCEKEVPVIRPKHNQKGRCSCCGTDIQYKSVGRLKKLITEEDSAYLIQRCNDGIVVREFTVRMMVSMTSYQKPMICWHERRRFVYTKEHNGEEFYYGYDRTEGNRRWIQGELRMFCGAGYPEYVFFKRGKVFTRNLSQLNKTVLRKTGLPEYIRKNDCMNPCAYLSELCEQPILEQIVKAELFCIAEEMVVQERTVSYRPAKELGKALLIDRFRLERLRKQNGGSIYLQWLRLEKEQNRVISDEVLMWMQKKNIQPTDLTFISDRMNPQQIKNYLERQSLETEESIKDLLITWHDYLIMAKRFGMDVTDPIVFRARELVRRHDELLERLGNVDMVKQAEELEEKYPLLSQVCEELKKYEYSNKDYQIIAPERAEDILIEGNELRHCINQVEKYFERMHKRESYILFLRRKEQPKKPYYTLEIEPDGTVRQKRTRYNRQDEDIELAIKFLKKWQVQLQKKISLEDRELAKQSRQLRAKEIDELREKQIKIHGNFNGKLLADLLEEDLMEVGEEELIAA